MSSTPRPRATAIRTPIGARRDKAYYRRKYYETKALAENLQARVRELENKMQRRSILYGLKERELNAEIRRLHVDNNIEDYGNSASHFMRMCRLYAEEARQNTNDLITPSGSDPSDNSVEEDEDDADDVVLTKISEKVSSEEDTSQMLHTYPGGFNTRYGSCCSICLESPTDPVSLNCEHSFCRACIIEWFSTSQSQFKCPTCRTD